MVLFLGKLTPRKRVDVLIRAFARMNRAGATLVIAGNDMGAEATLRSLAVEVGLGKRVRFVGLLRGPERLEALADANAVAYPGDHEVFGLVPVEALLCGTPVVVGSDSGCGEVVGATGGGLMVSPGDVDGLATALTELLDRPDSWRAAAQGAASAIRTSFSAETVAEQMELFYREVLGRRGLP